MFIAIENISVSGSQWINVTGRDSTDPFLSICTTGFPMRQGRSLMRDASSSGHGNNSTEIVTDVRICHPIFKSRSFQRFFFFRISLSLDEIRYYRVFFFYVVKEGVV